MYSFKRATIDREVYDYNISGYVKYIGYAIPILHGLTYYSKPLDETINGIVYICPRIKKLLNYSDSYHQTDFCPVKGIWAEISKSECKTDGKFTGYYGRIIVYSSNEKAIKFLEMLRDRLFSSPFYMHFTRDEGINKSATYIRKIDARLNAEAHNKPYIEPKPVNKNKYYRYHVDIDELNSFIEDLRNDSIEFSEERITVSSATNPIKPEPINEPSKRITWRWSV